MAEGVMKAKLEMRKIPAEIDSAGLLDYHAGEAPDRRATETAGKFNIDISEQKARQIAKKDLDEFDLILTMDRSVQRSVLGMAGKSEQSSRVHLFLDYAGKGIADVPDPYYVGPEGFEKVFRLIDDGCERIIDKLITGQ